jgi:hypothetical protein
VETRIKPLLADEDVQTTLFPEFAGQIQEQADITQVGILTAPKRENIKLAVILQSKGLKQPILVNISFADFDMLIQAYRNAQLQQV